MHLAAPGVDIYSSKNTKGYGLMSGTSMTREMLLLSEAFGWGLSDLQWVTVNALKSAFIPFDERLRLIDQVVKPGYAALAAEGL